MGQEAKSFFSGFLTFLYAENSGAMLSMGNSLSESLRAFLLIGVVSIGLIVWTIYLIFKASDKYLLSFCALIIGGGIGNLLSRIFNNGNVVDFIFIDLGFVSTGVFNVADISIMLGVALLLIHQSKTNKRSLPNSNINS